LNGPAPGVPPLEGRWRLDAEIDRGGESRIYAVTKVVDGEVRDDGSRLVAKVGWAPSGANEISYLLDVQHTNVVTYRDYGTIPVDQVDAFGMDRPPYQGARLVWLVMDRASASLGTDIDQAATPAGVVARKPIGWGRAEVVWRALLAGLGHLHQQDIVHGDVKPGNLLRFETNRGTVWRVSDFGLAVDLVTGASRVSKRGGTPAFESPMALAGGRVGPADDLYSAALTVHLAATGVMPRDERGAIRIDPSAPPALATELASALGALDPAEVPTIVDPAPEPVADPVPVPSRTVRNLVAGLLVAALVAALGLVLLHNRDSGSDGTATGPDTSSEQSSRVSVGTQGGSDGASGGKGKGDGSGGADVGSVVVFERRSGGTTSVIEVDLSSRKESVVPIGVAGPMSPSIAASGRVAVVSRSTEGNGSLALAEHGATEARTFDVAGSVSRAAISPDGRTVAYSSDAEGDDDIWLLDLGTGGSTKLAGGSADERDPAWSPDGKTVAFVRSGSRGDAIWSVDVQAHAERDLADGSGSKASPTWSGDGRVAFVGASLGGRDVFVVDASGKRTLLAPTPEDELGVAWCSTGLVTSASRRGLDLLDLDGSLVRHVTQGAGDGDPVCPADPDPGS
jgi:hypothetical protein